MIDHQAALILEHLQEKGQLTIHDAADLLDCSEITARRLFRRLDEQGRVQRLRGAIRPLGTDPLAQQTYSERQVQHSAVKYAIARKAASLLQPNDAVIVDGGTTTWHLAGRLPDIPLKVITNSVRLAAALDDRRGSLSTPEIHLCGGFLYPESGLLLGPHTKKTLASYNAAWTFLSVGGISERGISNTHELVTEVEQVMIQQGRKVAILADHSKIGQQALCQAAPLQDIDVLITDDNPETRPILERIATQGVEVITVPSPEN